MRDDFDTLAARPDAVEAQKTVTDALMDSQYLAGAKAGWNAAQADDPNAAYAELTSSRDGHLRGFKEARAALSEQPRTDAAGMRPMSDWESYEHRDEIVLLLVDFEDHPTDDAQFALTIGGNNDHNVGPDEGVGWQFAGWCWCHDHFVEGKGTPVGWLPLPHHLAKLAEQGRIDQALGEQR